MIIELDTDKKRLLLQSLSRGYLDTSDFPEMRNLNWFSDLLMESTITDEPGAGAATPANSETSKPLQR